MHRELQFNGHLEGHAYVLDPASESRSLLLLHGTGGNEYDLLALGKEVDPEATLISPRGKVLERGMLRFFKRLREGVFDLEDLQARTDDLDRFIVGAEARHGIDPEGMVALGFSNGANIAGSLLLRHGKRILGAILVRPMVPFEPEELPDLSGIPVLLLFGERDPIVVPAERERLTELFSAAGASVSRKVWPGVGHALIQEDVLAAREWLKTL